MSLASSYVLDIVLCCRNVREGDEAREKRMTCTVNLLVSLLRSSVSELVCSRTIKNNRLEHLESDSWSFSI